MKTKFTLLLVVAAISISQPSITMAQVDMQDSLALVDLYNSTDGPHWKKNTNWLTGPVINWYGINISGNKVKGISLNGNNLKGNIPPELGNLTDLEYLVLYLNQLSGSIPSELGNLTHLTILVLANNQLTGSIPPELGNLTKLYQLHLDNNQLTGSIPSSFARLSNLILL